MPTKSVTALRFKMYFDPKVKLVRVTDSLWDVLPKDCKDVVRDFEKEHLMAGRIQNHWRRVRYAPGTSPGFEGSARGKQRVLMFWALTGGVREYVKYATGDVLRKGLGHYDARIIPDDWNKLIYYYDQVKREKRHAEWAEKGFQNVGGENCARSYHEPSRVSIIKPW